MVEELQKQWMLQMVTQYVVARIYRLVRLVLYDYVNFAIICLRRCYVNVVCAGEHAEWDV